MRMIVIIRVATFFVGAMVPVLVTRRDQRRLCRIRSVLSMFLPLLLAIMIVSLPRGLGMWGG
jgi:hypothetical protein